MRQACHIDRREAIGLARDFGGSWKKWMEIPHGVALRKEWGQQQDHSGEWSFEHKECMGWASRAILHSSASGLCTTESASYP